MSEPEAETPQPAPSRRRCNWRRVRTYGWATLLGLSFWLFAVAFAIRHQPKRLVDNGLAAFPFPSSVSAVEWNGPDLLVIHDLKLGDFFYASSIQVRMSPRDLLRNHLTSVVVNEPELFMAELDKAVASAPKGENNGVGWTISKLVINRGTVMIDAGPGIPAIPVRVGARRPVIVNYLKLMKPDDSKVMTEEHVMELEDIHFASPFDPLAPVLSLPLVRIRFSYKEIWNHQIREIDLVRPNLFLGQDLFWFTDQFKKNRAAAAPAEVKTAPWQVGNFQIRYGQLTVNVFGQPRLYFPFFFDTDVDNIRLDQLDKITAKNAIVIRHFSKNYPDYKVKIVNLHGRLEFSVPPTSATANNVVPTVSIDELSWNNIAVTKAWASATFDPTGIYVKLGGTCEKGLMEGNFEVYYNKGFDWNADFFAHQIDCAPIAEKLAGKYGSLTGQLDGKISVEGLATDIKKCAGTLSLDQPGMLKIQSINDLINRIPAGMTSMKRDAMKLALNAFAVYPYTTGQLQLNYTPGDGVATLKLNGAYGKRDFSVYWHPFGASDVANGTDTH